MTDFKNMEINKYIDVLSSNAPMPGGGTVSALNGAMGISLILMVVNLSYGKNNFLQFNDDLMYIINEGEKIKKRFLELIDEDVVAYNKMIEVYNIKKDTVENIKLRNEKMEEALKFCIIPPINVLKLCIEAVKLANLSKDKTTKLAESDIKIGIDNLICAIKGAICNVNINIKYMKDTNEIDNIKKQLRNYMEELEKNNIILN